MPARWPSSSASGGSRWWSTPGPGGRFGPAAARIGRATAAHSTVEIDGVSSARFAAEGFVAAPSARRCCQGPTLVSVRQAQDATGEWLLATHDGYVASHGLLHERRLFVDSRGREFRGEEIVYVTDAPRPRPFDRRARGPGSARRCSPRGSTCTPRSSPISTRRGSSSS